MVRTSVTQLATPHVPLFLFLPHFDVVCDLLLNRRTATWNLFVNSQREVSLCERNIHDVSSFLTNVGEICCSISAQKTTKQIFFTICQFLDNLKTPTRTLHMNYSYASGCLSKPIPNSPNEQKQQETIKNRFWLR